MGRYFKRIYSIILQTFLMLCICISLSHAMPKKDSKDLTSSTASEACSSTDARSKNDDQNDCSELCKRIEKIVTQQQIKFSENLELLDPVANYWFEIGMLWQMPHCTLSTIRGSWISNDTCFLRLFKELIKIQPTFTKEFLLSIALPCGGNNFDIAVEVMKKCDIEEHDARAVLNFWMEEHPFNKQVLKNTAIRSDDIPLIYFNLFEIQSHITSLLTIMGLEDHKIELIKKSDSSHSMQLVYGFNRLINDLIGKQELMWSNIYEAIIILGKEKKEQNDVHTAKKLFQCGAKIQQKMI